MLSILYCLVSSFVLEQVSEVTMSEKLDYLSNCKSEISNVCNTVKGFCLKSIETVHPMLMAVLIG